MDHRAAVVLRQSILAVFLLGIAGSSAELILLGHHEDVKQLIPLILFGLAAAQLLWMSLTGARLAFRVFQATMALFVLSGLVGMWLHFQANREFQLEVDPSAAGWDLVMRVLRAKAPPALAPGMMVQFGLLGLAYAFRHPRLDHAAPFTRS
jgi:hypothetical protein